ncbi:MAG: hypothetical protein HW419_1025 [Deltaproteobacteria bacterium]|nr:hypothetical protein [Deltaproteobacteria bacterium]
MKIISSKEVSDFCSDNLNAALQTKSGPAEGNRKWVEIVSLG